MLISYASFTYLNGKKKGSRTYSSWEHKANYKSFNGYISIINVFFEVHRIGFGTRITK